MEDLEGEESSRERFLECKLEFGVKPPSRTDFEDEGPETWLMEVSILSWPNVDIAGSHEKRNRNQDYRDQVA